MEGINILLDVDEVCGRAVRKSNGKIGKLAKICSDKKHLYPTVKRGIEVGYNECESIFKYQRWNCTRLRKSMRKILLKGKFIQFN